MDTPPLWTPRQRYGQHFPSMQFDFRGRPLIIWLGRGAKRKKKFVRRVAAKKFVLGANEKKIMFDQFNHKKVFFFIGT